jgi:hypothetical protein
MAEPAPETETADWRNVADARYADGRGWKRGPGGFLLLLLLLVLVRRFGTANER